MWLPSPKLRTVAEVLLTIAVLAYVSYDMAGRGGGGRPSESGAPRQSGGAASLSSSPLSSPSVRAASSSPAPSPPARFRSQIDPAITGDNIMLICGSVTTANPLVVGETTAQAISFYGNANCPTQPTLLSVDPALGQFSTLQVRAGSWVSLQNVISPNLPAVCGLLLMDPNSYLEAVVPTTLVANPYLSVTFTLMTCGGVCPDLSTVKLRYSGCPTDSSLVKTGPYTCTLSGATVSQTCIIKLTIGGALSQQAPSYIRATLNKDCAVMTQTVFKQTIAASTGVSALAMVVTYYQCSSVSVIFTVLGADPVTAMAALGLIFQSMLAGPLAGLLGVVSAVLVDAPFPTAFTISTSYAKPYYPLVPYPILVSSSNPAFFALLSLLCIPVAFVITMCVYGAYRRRYIPPPPPPPPCPKPIPVPVCVPVCCPPAPACCCEPLCPSSPVCSPTFAGPSAYPPMETTSLICPPVKPGGAF